MRLRSIILCNFRQFYGKTEEIFLASGATNITIIHGNNGAGKTTLLNAFTWALYEKFSAAFTSPQQLVNKRALHEIKSGKPVECLVEVAFYHDSRRYRVKRICRAYKKMNGIEYSPTELSMWVAGDDGRWMPTHQNPEDIIGRILPSSLHQYFFFDGERIEHIFRDNRKTEIADATKELLGVEVFDRALRHLKAASKSLEEELGNLGDPQTQKLLQDKLKLEEQGDRINKRQLEIAQELEKHQEFKRTINSRLLELSGAKELQDRRASLEAQEKHLREQLKQAKVGIKRAINTKGYSFLLSEATAEFRTIVEQLRQKGQLPTGITQQFVRELLKQQRCICGGDLKEGTHGFDTIQSWIEKAGIADVEETAIRMSAQIEEIDKQAPEFWREVDRQQGNVKQWRAELSRVETEMDNLKNKLRTNPNENIQQLQQRLDEIEAKISQLQRETGANQHNLDKIRADIEVKVKQMSKQQTNEQKQRLAQRRLEATVDAMKRIAEVKNRLDKQFRWQLEQRVQEIFSQISFTPYVPKLSEKYELTLVENTAGLEVSVAASTGENQILSLSFIGGIIDRVREWSKSKMHMGPDSSTFPMVMDSPFGSLDEIYRRQVASSLPQLANQLVVLVTKTQWRVEVEEEMTPRIGREYLLVYNSPKPDCEEDSIQLGGVRYPLVRRSPNEFEYTEIVEVERHG